MQVLLDTHVVLGLLRGDFPERHPVLADALSDPATIGFVSVASLWEIAIKTRLALKGLVATAAQLTDTLAADPLAHVVHGYHRFRRYAPRMLRLLDIQAAPVAVPLLEAAGVIAGTDTTVLRPLAFLRRGSKWQRHLNGVTTRKCSDCSVRVNIPGTQGASIWACHVAVREDWISLGSEHLSGHSPRDRAVASFGNCWSIPR